MSPVFVRVNPGDPVQAQNLDQVIDALNGTTAKGVPIAVSAVNDASNYALTVQNIEPTSSRALNVLNSGGTSMVRVDSSGVTLGSPLNLAAGSITTPAIADRNVTNVKLGTDTARLNLLTNGGFEIWQRGNGPFTTTAAYSADRWLSSIGGTSTLSVSRDTTNVDASSAASAALTYTHNVASLWYQKIEDTPQLKGRTLTFSVRVRTSTANAIRARIDGPTGLTVGAFHTGDGTWQTLTVTGTMAAAPSSVLVALELNASCTAYVDNAMLVVGSVAADYAPLHPADDLARCLRYYEGVGGSSSLMVAGWAGSAGEAIGTVWRWLAQKPVIPTVTKIGTLSVSNCSQPNIAGPGLDGAQIYCTAIAIGHVQYVTGGAAGWFVVEANP